MDIKFGKYIRFTRGAKIDIPEIAALVDKVENFDGSLIKPFVLHGRVIEHSLVISEKGRKHSRIVGAAAIADPNEDYVDLWDLGIETDPGKSHRMKQVGMAVVDISFRDRNLGLGLLDTQIRTIQNIYQATPVSVVREENRQSQEAYEQFGGVPVARGVMTERGPVDLWVFNDYLGKLAA